MLLITIKVIKNDVVLSMLQETNFRKQIKRCH